jgi:DNA polymerase III subunit chi
VAEIRFYHLQRQRLEEALPKLMEKVHEAGLKSVIKAPDEAVRNALDKALWTYDPVSFIPHDKEGSAYATVQPMFLTCNDENPNAATVQVIINAVEGTNAEVFDRCLYMFDGRDERIVAKARADWKAFKDLGVEMSYWQQKETGGWEQKA